MGSPFQDYQQAQLESQQFAKNQRRIQRYGIWYLAFSIVSSLVTAFLAPKLLLPSLIFSATCYGVYRFGSWAYTKTKHWYLDRQAKRAIAGGNGGSEEPLLAHNTRRGLRTLAHDRITQALIHKQVRVSHYAKDATFKDSEPLGYNDRKHQRALFQYQMLERTKEAALRGDENFIQEFEHDKQERRHRKTDILNMLLNDYLLTSKISITLRSVDWRSNEDEWVIAGEKAGLISLLETWNNNGPTPFLPLPPGLTKAGKEKFLCQSLLPLLLDRDQILSKVLPLKIEMISYRFGTMMYQRTYVITEGYVRERIGGIMTEKPRTLATHL